MKKNDDMQTKIGEVIKKKNKYSSLDLDNKKTYLQLSFFTYEQQ